MGNVEERLGNLEASVSQLALNDPEMSKRLETLGRREKMERERERDRSASRNPSFLGTSQSDSKKKKKKKPILPEDEQREAARGPAPDFVFRSATSSGGDEVRLYLPSLQFSIRSFVCLFSFGFSCIHIDRRRTSAQATGSV